MPRAKANSVVIHRLEFQDKEREALDMISASYTAEKVSKSLENLLNGSSSLISAFTRATPAGVIFAGSTFGAVTAYIFRDEIESGFQNFTVNVGTAVDEASGGRARKWAWRLFGPKGEWAQFKTALDVAIKEL